MTEASQPIGTVRLVRRFPVKGMSGEELDEVFVTFAGLIGDRVYAFLDPKNTTDFPWMTPRIWPGMLLLKPKFISPPVANDVRPSQENYSVQVTLPDGVTHNISDSPLHEYLEKHFARPIVRRFSERSMHDARPVSVFGLQTMDALGKECGRALDPRRFRANFVVDWNSRRPFFEDSLVGRTIRIGEKMSLVIAKKNMRCKVITFDPDTAEAAPEVLEVVARKHESCAGVYGAVLREGIVRRGDPVFVD